MSFCDEVRKEIISKPIKEKHCKYAFLSGLIRGNGVLFTKDDKLGFEFSVKDEKTAYLLGEYFLELFNYELREIAVQNSKNKEKFIITLTEDNAEEILKTLKIIDEKDGNYIVVSEYPEELLDKECCKVAFIKGVFLSAGNCTLPNENKSSKTGYHLQISCSHSSFASILSDVLQKNRINVKISRNKGAYLVYLKSAEEISDFLAYIQAPVSVIKLTDTMVERTFINGVNRRKNCDLGNVNRQLDATIKQTNAINLIEKTIGIKNLKKDLQEVCFARLDNPEDSIIELSKKLNLSKSCINHRFRKIISIAEEIKE